MFALHVLHVVIFSFSNDEFMSVFSLLICRLRVKLRARKTSKTLLVKSQSFLTHKILSYVKAKTLNIIYKPWAINSPDVLLLTQNCYVFP